MTMQWAHLGIPMAGLMLLTASYTADARAPEPAASSNRDASDDSPSKNRPSDGSGDRQSRIEPSSPTGRETGTHSSRSRWAQISGDIERAKKVSIRGGGPEHMAVLIHTDHGRRVIADLGPAKDLRDLELRSGDWIAARGPVARVNGHRVLFAKQLFMDGHTVDIQRHDQSQHSRAQQSSQSVTGLIQDMKELKVKGSGKTHQVVRMKTDQGQDILADLGAKKDLRDLSITKGQRLTVDGRMLRVSGKRFLMADQIRTDGKTVQLDRQLMSAIPAAGHSGRRTSGQRDMQTVSGEVIIKGEVLKLDRDGFYVVQDPSGRQVHLLVAQEMNQGFNVGDQIRAQVKPDGSVTSISKMTDQSTEPSAASQSQGQQGQRHPQQEGH